MRGVQNLASSGSDYNRCVRFSPGLASSPDFRLALHSPADG